MYKHVYTLFGFISVFIGAQDGAESERSALGVIVIVVASRQLVLIAPRPSNERGEGGGVVGVMLNKKLWQEIIKGLHLPSSITSAAFTLRTQ